MRSLVLRRDGSRSWIDLPQRLFVYREAIKREAVRAYAGQAGQFDCKPARYVEYVAHEAQTVAFPIYLPKGWQLWIGYFYLSQQMLSDSIAGVALGEAFRNCRPHECNEYHTLWIKPQQAEQDLCVFKIIGAGRPEAA